MSAAPSLCPCPSSLKTRVLYSVCAFLRPGSPSALNGSCEAPSAHGVKYPVSNTSSLCHVGHQGARGRATRGLGVLSLSPSLWFRVTVATQRYRANDKQAPAMASSRVSWLRGEGGGGAEDGGCILCSGPALYEYFLGPSLVTPWEVPPPHSLPRGQSDSLAGKRKSRAVWHHGFHPSV